ncbi:DUF3945 domain-containing protein [Elizabethkingia occulta]|uniref:DUF3945 domain-containing protein n=1 Tax=Elizabethkingia occulta TaxID=1867263 RepID=UPI00398C5D8F
MDEQNIENPQINEPDQLSDILLVMDKEKKVIQAVKGIGKNGELETIDPKKDNESQFMRVDKHGDVFSNFFSNFFRQLKNPSRFSFFKVPEEDAIKVAEAIQKHIEQPNAKSEKLMKQHEVQPSIESHQKQSSQNNMETKQTAPEANEYRYNIESIDWETMSNLGLSKEKLEKLNLLDPLLRGFKTNELVPISLNLGTAITKLDARLSLQPDDKGNTVVAIHGIRKEPNLNYPFFGHEFSKEDKENLLSTGNMGRIVNLTNPKTKEIIPSIISIDRLTNELVALRSSKIIIPDEKNGIKLNDQQKQILQEGKPLHLEGMISKKGKSFDATLQFNADKRFVEFLFDKGNSNRQNISNNKQNTSVDLLHAWRGKELSEDQRQKLKDGQVVYMSMIDKKGEPYQGYITFDKEKNKIEFSFDNPEKLKAQAKPTESHKTQTAVNSDGKTNEPTKNINEPLKSAQIAPKNQKQKEQQNKDTKPARSRGKKV